jgi:Ca-activated chloride channel family protein
MDATFLNSVAFANPIFLKILPVVLAVMAGIYWMAENRWRVAMQVMSAPRLRAANVRFSFVKARWQAGLLMAAIVGCLLALARPQAGYVTVESAAPARAGLLLLDVSNSMLAADVSPDRLTRAKLLAKDILQDAGDAEVGLAVFSGEARLLVPPTRDHELVTGLLWKADRQAVGRGGTNFENALHEVLAVLGPLPHQEKFFVMLTDGEDLEGSAGPIVDALVKAGIRGYVAVFGTEEGAPIRQTDQFGRPFMVSDPQGRTVISKANRQAMSALAERVDGALIDGPIPFGERGSVVRAVGTFRAARELFWVPTSLAFLCTTLHFLLGARKKLSLRSLKKDVELTTLLT